MDHDLLADPKFFLKPWSAQAHPPVGCELDLPPGLNLIHHEVELVVRLARAPDGLMIPESVAIGIDLTEREIQAEAKREGLPWTESKGFRNSAILGGFAALPIGLEHHRLELAINGAPRQEAAISDCLFSVLELIESLEKWAPLEAGDLLFCGTPAGVGAMADGDRVEARLLNPDGEPISEIDLTLRIP
jgi:fumarylpyruvate hydrolase